jgi:hypothetical protein
MCILVVLLLYPHCTAFFGTLRTQQEEEGLSRNTIETLECCCRPGIVCLYIELSTLIDYSCSLCPDLLCKVGFAPNDYYTSCQSEIVLVDGRRTDSAESNQSNESNTNDISLSDLNFLRKKCATNIFVNDLRTNI